MKKVLILFIMLMISSMLFGWPKSKKKSVSQQEVITEVKEDIPQIPQEPELLSVFRESYPDLVFYSTYDEEYKDWKIIVSIGERNVPFYWNNGSFIPPEEMENKGKYWTLLYGYNYKKPLEDPANFTPEQIAAMKKFGSDENRKNDAGTPMFFFDAIYDSNTRGALEKHIKTVKFLGFSVNVHERLKEPLAAVQKRIYEAAETDKEVKDYLNNINRNEGYYWRLIANTNRKSFHSLGIALDIQPKSYKRKEVYWSWAKDKNPDGWMLTPLRDRWMPPQAVIDIFEEEGFIWGGKWGIWDNMHFEYHPELINMARLNLQ